MSFDDISVISNRRHIRLLTEDILYIQLSGRQSIIHFSDGRTYETYATIHELESLLSSGFIRADRATLVSIKGIHDIGTEIELVNGDTLYDSDAPTTQEEYQRHYASYDSAPFAFTDIEMVFNEERAAVDWIFRYGNEALAELEKTPLQQLINHSFGSIFPNMDAKWLRVYERTALFGETLEIVYYSPEIDTKLKIISFPTFKGHCGCMLFKQTDIQTVGEYAAP